MNKSKKEISTVGVIITLLLITFFYLTYEEYEYTYQTEQRIQESYDIAITELNTSIYKSLKRESELKATKVAKEIRVELLKQYGDDLSKFAKEYDYLEEDSILMTTIDNVIHSEENRFFHIETDANDMFVLSNNGVVSDKSQDCSTFGSTREYADEISMHFNKKLAEQAVDAMLLGNESDIFWRFRNTTFDKNIRLDKMNIEEALKLPLKDLKDYEFLSVTYIDKYVDILGRQDVTSKGIKQDTRKLIVVQGFNLYEQIQDEFKPSYVRIERNMKTQLLLMEENRNMIKQKLVITSVLIFVCFFAMAIIQNHLIKERLHNERATDRRS